MKDNKTDSKLGTEQEHGEIVETRALENSASQTARPRFKIKFTDYAVDKFVTSFFVDGKLRARTYTPFDVSRHTILKGLKLVQFQKTKKKYFILRYWFQQQYKMMTIGEFVLDKFGCRECENKVYGIAREHQNEKGIWVKDPQLTIRDKETKIVKAVIVESQKLTINQVIERYVAAGFPRKKGKTKRGSSIKRDCLNLLGHNWRTKHLIFDDINGKGS